MLKWEVIVIGNAMKFNYRKISFLVLAFIFFYLMLKIFFQVVWINDEDRERIIYALSESDVVKKEIGDLESYKVARRVNFSGDQTRSGYKEFVILINGEKGRAKVRVIIYKENNDLSIEVMNSQ